MFQLRSFLSLSEDENLNPMLPNSAPDMKMEYNLVLSKALDRNSFAQNIRRRQLEADYEVATARGICVASTCLPAWDIQGRIVI